MEKLERGDLIRDHISVGPFQKTSPCLRLVCQRLWYVVIPISLSLIISWPLKWGTNDAGHTGEEGERGHSQHSRLVKGRWRGHRGWQFLDVFHILPIHKEDKHGGNFLGPLPLVWKPGWAQALMCKVDCFISLKLSFWSLLCLISLTHVAKWMSSSSSVVGESERFFWTFCSRHYENNWKINLLNVVYLFRWWHWVWAEVVRF